MMRNLDPNRMFAEMAKRHRPTYRFEGHTQADFDAWQAAALPAVMACLGDIPATVPPNPELEAEWCERGIRMQRWVIDVHADLSATVLVNIPAELGAGERSPARKPNHSGVAGGRDWCNLLYLHATMFGTTSIAINVQHGRMATDFVLTLPEVDGTRLGVMGLSGGGTATTWSYLCDARFRAAEIICYCDHWAAFGMRDVNYCGMQVAPGLYKLLDLPDLQGLLAPKPLLMDIGIRDQCFRVETALPAYRQLERIYQVAGASDRLELDLHPNDHGWGGNRSVAFFNKHLAKDDVS